MHAAVDAATADGHFTPEQAEALKAHPGGADAATLRPVQSYFGSKPIGLPGESATGVPPGYRGPVFDQQKYAAATSQYAQHANDKMSMAAADPALQATILNIRDTPGAGKKQALADAYMASVANDPAKAQLATMLLSGPLLDSKVP